MSVSCLVNATDVGVTHRAGHGGMVDTSLDRMAAEDVLSVREFRWYHGRRHYLGWCWSATTGRLVAYEGRLELAPSTPGEGLVPVGGGKFLVPGA